LKTKISTPVEVDGSDKSELIESSISEDFSKEDLDKVWQEFVDIRKENGKDQEVMLLKEAYTLEDTKVILKLSNEVLKYTFNNIKVELQGFLRANLHNNKIVVDSIIEEIENEDMMYTNKEKFEHLAKKYPSLKELQQKLGLDPDY
jgi:hypothetical protein